MTDHTCFAVSRTEAELASELIALFGSTAAHEAKRRGNKARDKGNALHFCTWRKAEQLITLLDPDTHRQTIH